MNVVYKQNECRIYLSVIMNIETFMSFSVLSSSFGRQTSFSRDTVVVHDNPEIPVLKNSIPNDDMREVWLPAMLLPRFLKPVAVPATTTTATNDVGFPALNPSLYLNNDRPTLDDIDGFGPSKRNIHKSSKGIRCFDSVVCDNDEHETFKKRKNAHRMKSTCRMCVKDTVKTVPVHATHWQTSRYITALFRNYFCPFCLLESPRSKMYNVNCKLQCKKHAVANRLVKCAHGKEWRYCKECVFDVRSSTFYCACCQSLSARVNCMCTDEIKTLSYGIRLHTNPFTVPTAEVIIQEDLWAASSIECASAAKKSAGGSQKRARKNAGVKVGPFLEPRL